MSWHFWSQGPFALPAAAEDTLMQLDTSEGGTEHTDTLSMLSAVAVSDDGDSGCWHVRPLPDTVAHTPQAPQQRHESHRARSTESLDLHRIGLPDHLIPAGRGIFELLDLFERLPRPRIPALRPGDDIAAITVGQPGTESHPSELDTTRLAAEITRSLRITDTDAGSATVHVLAWPTEKDPGSGETAESQLVEQVRVLRARLKLIVVHPDCPGTLAYTAC